MVLLSPKDVGLYIIFQRLPLHVKLPELLLAGLRPVRADISKISFVFFNFIYKEHLHFTLGTKQMHISRFCSFIDFLVISLD